MAWVTPPTFVSGNVLTAAQLNTLTGDLNETAPAKATASGQVFVSTAANAIAARAVAQASVGGVSGESTTSTTFADLTTPGPAVTLTTGTSVLVFLTCFLGNQSASNISEMGFAVSGATTVVAGTYASIRYSNETVVNPSVAGNACLSLVAPVTGLTAGSNTFTAKYKSGASGTAVFNSRSIIVIPIN